MFSRLHHKVYRTAHSAFYVVWIACLLILLSGCIGGTNTGNKNQGNQGAPSSAIQPIQCSEHSSNPVQLTMYYGSEKQAWMQDVVANFNSLHMTACDGPITVKATPIGSGLSMQEIVSGKIQPDIWSPAGSVWLTLINAMWQKQHSSGLISTGATDSPSLVTSPVVIAMWKPEAIALGWPTKAIGWSDIADLSTNPRGWAAYGHPEFGDFKFGHTRPDDSNSGLDAIIAENYAALGKVRELSLSDVNNPVTRDFVSNVESSIIHYGDSTGFFANEMFTKGPNYLSAAVMYESLVVEANEGKAYPHLAYPVVAIYPKEGTFYSDHPFAILQASWVTPEKKAAALEFRNFLLAPAQQKKALQYGFRPADLSIGISSPVDSSHGVDTSEPKNLLQVPSASVIQAIESSWEDQRRKVDVMLVLDRSGSMNETVNGQSKIEKAKQGLIQFVNLLGNSDGVGLTVFSTDANVLTPVSALGPKHQDLLNTINSIQASGNTRLFDTIAEQVNSLKSIPSKHIKVVIVLTDGLDNNSQLTISSLINHIAASGANAGEGVKVYTIAYGSDADVSGLVRIASATGGLEYAGTPQNIIQIYTQISQFF